MEIFFIFVGAVILVSALMLVATRYRLCPADKILVVYGKVGGDRTVRCIHGGGTLVWPLIQDYAYMSLTPMTVSIPLTDALTLRNVRVNMISSFTVRISYDPDIMGNAADCLLNQSVDGIEDLARNVIIGPLRLTVASLSIEQLKGDRENLHALIRVNVEPELNRIGLHLIDVNVIGITEEAGSIQSNGKVD